MGRSWDAHINDTGNSGNNSGDNRGRNRADGAIELGEEERTLQQLFTTTENVSERHGMKLNRKKCELIVLDLKDKQEEDTGHHGA